MWNNWYWESPVDYHWTADSFDSDLPENWEEVCDEANSIIDRHIEENPEESETDFREFLTALWEKSMNDMMVGNIEIIG